MTDLLELAGTVEAMRFGSNEVDVLVEVALFEPDDNFSAMRANSAGTKIICTMRDGTEETYWAGDWTFNADERQQTAAALRARAHQGTGDDVEVGK